MIILGFRTSIRELAIVTLVCRVCGNLAAHQVSKRTTKFTLFFIPLFPVRTRYRARCGVCGSEYGFSRAEAARVAG